MHLKALQFLMNFSKVRHQTQIHKREVQKQRSLPLAVLSSLCISPLLPSTASNSSSLPLVLLLLLCHSTRVLPPLTTAAGTRAPEQQSCWQEANIKWWDCSHCICSSLLSYSWSASASTGSSVFFIVGTRKNISDFCKSNLCNRR